MRRGRAGASQRGRGSGVGGAGVFSTDLKIVKMGSLVCYGFLDFKLAYREPAVISLNYMLP